MEYEFLFTKSLHEKLKERIKGHIFCKVIDDTLVVNIDTREGVDYGLCISDFANRIRLKEISQETLIDDIVKNYKKKVLEIFFY